ncbi:MAG: antitoxin [Trebonia sp.]
MPDFGKLIQKAKDLAGKHQDQVHTGVEKAEDFADKKLGDKFSGQVDEAGNLVEGTLGIHDPEQAPQGDAPRNTEGNAGA